MNPTSLSKLFTSYISNPFTVFIESFKALRVNLTTLISLYLISLVAIVPIALVLVGSFALASRGNKVDISAGLVVVVLLLVVLGSIFQAAYVAYVVHTVQAKTIGVKEALRTGLEKALPLLGLAILIGVIVVIGLILLIIPGLIFAYWLMFSPYVLINEDTGVFEAMKRSRQLVKGKLAEIGGLVGVAMIFSLPSAIPFIGSAYQIILTPTSQIAFGYRYISALNLKKSGKQKPKTDPANYWAMAAVLIVPLLFLLVIIIIALAQAGGKY